MGGRGRDGMGWDGAGLVGWLSGVFFFTRGGWPCGGDGMRMGVKVIMRFERGGIWTDVRMGL